MSYASRYLTYVIDLFIFFVIILSVKKKVGKVSGRTGGTANSKKITTLKSHDGMTLKDDRSSDWMAMQLKEEAQAMARVSEMFKLKQQHMNNCDAEFIKRFHESNCDASGVDDGTRKKSGKK